MRLIFELSGENPTIPLAELECIGTITDSRDQVAVAECPDPAAVSRLAMTHRVMEYLGECGPDLPSFRSLLRDLGIATSLSFAGRMKRIGPADGGRGPGRCSQKEFERLIGTMIEGPVDLSRPEEEYRAIVSGDRCYFGRVISTIDRGGYDSRNPGRRPFFHPGVMMPRMARALVNLSCVQPGETLIDPFCGTGGTLIEAEMLGIEAIGSDFDPLMIGGSRQNSPETSLVGADATALPFRTGSADAVVTDFPYGQSVCILREGSMEGLYDQALGEICRILRPGRRAVVVTHRDISGIAEGHLRVLQKHEQRVHKSLTRRVLVLRS
ncbi:MAG TPA: methyltransferase domain-containing protein [Methanoregulaceae archaeon]|nr:methyltransferase domain-containing protein [Methanoregulaceae archaeon]HRY74650.1 methyltransferase domain-containing protein [Methanoregulaceae archaeon]